MRRIFILPLIFLCLLLVAACKPEPDLEPVVVYITATPENNNLVVSAASPTPFPTLTLPPSFPTATLTATPNSLSSPTAYASMTAIAFPSSTATPFPSITPLPPSPTPVDLDSLPSFPTATPSATIEGVPSPTPFPSSEPPTLESVGGIAAPTSVEITAIATPAYVAQLVPPETLGELEIIPPAAISNLAPPPDQLPILIASRIGVQLHPFVTNEEWANALNLTRQLSMGWVKFQMPWDVAEPSPGQYSFEYQRLVLLVQQAHIDGFKVLVSVTRAPDWARPQGADPTQEGPPADPAALANFIAKLTSDIKPEFMEALEVWNEPNLMREWQGAEMNGGTYMRYFEAAYNAAKAVDPTVLVVTAGLAPVGDIPGAAEDDSQFLKEMYAAGLANFPDARIGVHPYAWGNPPDSRCCTSAPWADNPKFFMLETLDEYHRIMLANGDTTRRLWITEFGWGTFQGIKADGSDGQPPEGALFFNDITLQEQAEYTVRALQLMQSDPYIEFIERVFLWNMNFATIQGAVDNRIEQAGYSLLNAGGTPRPLFYYLLNTRKAYEKNGT
jgi:hypothetical protein